MQAYETQGTTAVTNIWIYNCRSSRAQISQSQAVKNEQFLWFIVWSDLNYITPRA